VLLSFRQNLERPGLSKRHFCAFDRPKRRSACLGLSSFWRNDHTWDREADIKIDMKIAATTTASAVGTRASLSQPSGCSRLIGARRGPDCLPFQTSRSDREDDSTIRYVQDTLVQQISYRYPIIDRGASSVHSKI